MLADVQFDPAYAATWKPIAGWVNMLHVNAVPWGRLRNLWKHTLQQAAQKTHPWSAAPSVALDLWTTLKTGGPLQGVHGQRASRIDQRHVGVDG